MSAASDKLPSPEELKKDVVVATNETLQSLRSLVSGGVGGVCAVVVGHPFDLVKVRLQTAEKGVYTGAMDVVRKIVGKAGPMGLYAGVTAPLAGVTPMCKFNQPVLKIFHKREADVRRSRYLLLGLRSRQATRIQRL